MSKQKAFSITNRNDRDALGVPVRENPRIPMCNALPRPSPIDLTWFDYGEKKLAIFYERLEDGLWYGEDSSFFRFRVPESVTVEALLVGTVLHGGVPLTLSTL